LALSISWTTRKIRPGESEDAYVFVSRKRFLAAVDVGFFLEWEEFGHNLYGTPRPNAGAGPNGGHSAVLLEIDAKGARTVRRLEPSSLIIGLEPPSLAALRDRMGGRGDSPEHIERRVKIADEEMALARSIADHVVVNDDLGSAVDEVVHLIEAWLQERSTR
jgi:guanylate kinase